MKNFSQKLPVVSLEETIFVVKKFSKLNPEKFFTYAVCVKSDATESDIIMALKLDRRVDAIGCCREIINTGIKPYINCINDSQFEFSEI